MVFRESWVVVTFILFYVTQVVHPSTSWASGLSPQGPSCENVFSQTRAETQDRSADRVDSAKNELEKLLSESDFTVHVEQLYPLTFQVRTPREPIESVIEKAIHDIKSNKPVDDTESLSGLFDPARDVMSIASEFIQNQSSYRMLKESSLTGPGPVEPTIPKARGARSFFNRIKQNILGRQAPHPHQETSSRGEPNGMEVRRIQDLNSKLMVAENYSQYLLRKVQSELSRLESFKKAFTIEVRSLIEQRPQLTSSGQARLESVDHTIRIMTEQSALLRTVILTLQNQIKLNNDVIREAIPSSSPWRSSVAAESDGVRPEIKWIAAHAELRAPRTVEVLESFISLNSRALDYIEVRVLLESKALQVRDKVLLLRQFTLINLDRLTPEEAYGVASFFKEHRAFKMLEEFVRNYGTHGKTKLTPEECLALVQLLPADVSYIFVKVGLMKFYLRNFAHKFSESDLQPIRDHISLLELVYKEY